MQQQFENELHLSDYIRIVRNRRKVLITFFLTTVTIVTVASFLMKPIYRATVTLYIDRESPNILTTSGEVSMGDSGYYSYQEYLQSQKEIIRSQSILAKIFKDFQLGNQKEYQNSRNPVEKFLKTTSVDSVRDTRLLLLNVDNESPKSASDIANRIAELYVSRNLAYITKNEVLNLLKNEYLKLQTRLSEYSKIYKSKHPKMIRLEQEIRQMVYRIKEEKERVVDYDIEDMSISSQASSGAVLAGLKANNVFIQDRAEVPLLPERPKKRLNILLSIIVGFFGGIGLVFFFEYLDDTIKGSDDIERLVRWPFLGSIPKIDASHKLSDNEKDIFVHLKPTDPISEAYRVIRTSVLFSITQENPLKSIIITSPGPQEGKTTTLCNFAITMAQNRSRVLLIDADMRKPRLNGVFNKGNKVGLSNFLSGQVEFKQITQATDIENLSLVCAGPHPPNPSELISSRKMKDFIDIAKGSFDFILFDTPPMAVVTDAVILSKIADGTILVMESGRTRRRMLPRLNKVLQEAKAKIVGTILNRVDLNSGNYQYYTEYYSSKS
ncbi:MAG: polysaccharide biosynthesis tyrosine autokinase [Candidatus Omnitrophota bacterium]